MHYSTQIRNGAAVFILTVSILTCGQKKSEPKQTLYVDSSDQKELQKIDFEESLNDTDAIVNNFRFNELQPIRDNFLAINSRKNWTNTIKVDLEESTEGGEATYFFLGDKLEKIIAKIYGETYQQLNEYYLSNGQLSFVLERNLQYNRPIYFDSIAMVENGDNEFFDIDKSKYNEYRNYFIDSELVHQVHNKTARTEIDKDYIKNESRRILEEYNLILEYLKKKSKKY